MKDLWQSQPEGKRFVCKVCKALSASCEFLFQILYRFGMGWVGLCWWHVLPADEERKGTGLLDMVNVVKKVLST